MAAVMRDTHPAQHSFDRKSCSSDAIRAPAKKRASKKTYAPCTPVMDLMLPFRDLSAPSYHSMIWANNVEVETVVEGRVVCWLRIHSARYSGPCFNPIRPAESTQCARLSRSNQASTSRDHSGPKSFAESSLTALAAQAGSSPTSRHFGMYAGGKDNDSACSSCSGGKACCAELSMSGKDLGAVEGPNNEDCCFDFFPTGAIVASLVTPCFDTNFRFRAPFSVRSVGAFPFVEPPTMSTNVSANENPSEEECTRSAVVVERPGTNPYGL